MSKNPNVQFISQLESLELAQQKIADRQEFMSLPPLEAQAILNKTLDPNLLKPEFIWSRELNPLSLVSDEDEELEY